jgi:catechol 2,3-dioxygenase-like lactoylglutathione lyase family enzyme
MAKATGIGGTFFRARNPGALQAWYCEHLGMEPDPDGAVVLRWAGHPEGATVWAPFPDDTDYWPAAQQAMVNFRVDDLDGVLERLRAAGAEVIDTGHEIFNGRFGWAIDPEGNRFELWQPEPGF